VTKTPWLERVVLKLGSLLPAFVLLPCKPCANRSGSGYFVMDRTRSQLACPSRFVHRSGVQRSGEYYLARRYLMWDEPIPDLHIPSPFLFIFCLYGVE
jgi:hypothetical protein